MHRARLGIYRVDRVREYIGACFRAIFTIDILQGSIAERVHLANHGGPSYPMVDRDKYMAVLYATCVKFGLNTEVEQMYMRIWFKQPANWILAAFRFAERRRRKNN
jgi:hypothetical protein